MTAMAKPGDTIRIAVGSLTQRDENDVAVPITAGATGVANLYDWDDGDLVAGSPHAMAQVGSTAKWYVDVDAPAVGHYRVKAVITSNQQQETFFRELQVKDGTPT